MIQVRYLIRSHRDFMRYHIHLISARSANSHFETRRGLSHSLGATKRGESQYETADQCGWELVGPRAGFK